MGKFLYFISLFLVIASVQAAPAFAANDENTFYSSLMQMAWGLFIVMGILLILYGIAKKKMSFIQGSGNNIIKVIDTRHLMPKKTLYLIEVRGQEYLIGGGGDSLHLISQVQTEKDAPFSEILENAKGTDK